MINSLKTDIEAIEELHQIDVEATKAGQWERLKSLMDAECTVMPPDGDVETGRSFLDRVIAAQGTKGSREEVLELVQDWEELQVFGDLAYEIGVVYYSVRNQDGNIVKESQRLMRILRRQKNGSWRVLRAMWQAPRPAQYVARR